MAIIRQILRQKGADVWSVLPDDSVLTALQRMEQKNTGSVLVIDPVKGLIGIFSERDYARKVVLKGKRSAETRVREVMTPEPISVDPDVRLETCMELMTEHRIRHLPVMKGNRLLGVISIGDIVKAIIDEQRRTIRDLESYIQGGVGLADSAPAENGGR